MSLTRTEWIRMWHETKELERQINNFSDIETVNERTKRSMRTSITEIKRLIQSVIGQMEP
jgi:hypothetical protein